VSKYADHKQINGDPQHITGLHEEQRQTMGV